MTQRVSSAAVLRHESREDIARIASAHGARNVRVFGSAGRGEAGSGSDLDLLVEMSEDRNLFDLIALSQELGADARGRGGRSQRGGPLSLSARANPRRGGPAVKDEQVYLLHIRDAIDRILNYTWKVGTPSWATR